MEESVEVRIGRYLAGEMDIPEKMAFEQDLAADQALKATFHAFQTIWNQVPVTEVNNWDTQQALDRFSVHTIHPVFAGKKKHASLYWAIAASLILLLGAAWFLFLKPVPKTYLYADTGPSAVELPDGSKVFLNEGGSIVVYPFTHKKRHIQLSGEAFFEVSPDVGRPFTIDCGQTLTEVVGTAFNLKQTGKVVQLFVSSGKVIFRSENNDEPSLALTAGESALYADHKLKIVPNPSPNTNAWHTRQLQFVNIPLPEVVKDISDYFNVPVIVEDQRVNACRISIIRPLKQPEISGVLDVITRILNATWEKKGDSYIIKGGNCS